MIDVEQFTVKVMARKSFSSKEFQLLYFLASNPGKVMTEIHIKRNLGNDVYVVDRTIDVHIRKSS